MKYGWIVQGALWAGCALTGTPSGAQDAPSAKPTLQQEQQAAGEAVAKALQKGPADIALGGHVTLHLPERMNFVPAGPGGRLMRSMGNSVGPDFQGLVFVATKEDDPSLFELTYEAAGYIKDDDAKDWKADDLLQQVRQGTEEGNQRRREMGVSELDVTGWIETPRYDAQKHQLVWSIGARERGAPAGTAEGVNYRTLVLGREGYLAMTLITDRDHVDALKPVAAQLLDQLRFDSGKQYADFDSSTDHVAAFGLAALVAGVAAKKLGLIALIAAFAVKFAKVIALAVAGVFWALRKKMGWQGKASAPAPLSASTDSGLTAPQAAATPPPAPPKAP